MQPNGRAQDDRGGLDSFKACIRRATGTDARTGSRGPDVRVVSPSALAANAEEHERVLSLLPVQARSRLLAAGSLGHCAQDVHQRVPLEASSGVVLLTGGQERSLAPRLVDALAWQLGATSVLCSDAGSDAPGGFNIDLTPNMSDPANVRYMRHKRQESYSALMQILSAAATRREEQAAGGAQP
jgi:hypothetical protein